ncbi:MAG: WecB/TagA/CpsF family glycosyltransferase [Candidatus Moranbacteria bacterium]|nr:WecB/TagA/CpsF family glycosyltransferase [Candidatus Moranbacteria bacterium]
MKLLGVRVDNLTKREILEKVKVFLSEKKFHQIATINPEFILEAQKNTNFSKILNRCDLNVADGIGIKFGFLRFGEFLKARFAGVDLLEKILEIANAKKLSVFLAISKNGLSSYEEIKAVLEKKYPNIQISGEDIDQNYTDYRLLVTDCCILFSNFGAPYQESFIRNQKDAKIRLAMGVGGAFDFITEKIRRAPKLLRFFGFEWLWRFMQEPAYRFTRIFNAVIVFPVKIIFSKNQND